MNCFTLNLPHVAVITIGCAFAAESSVRVTRGKKPQKPMVKTVEAKPHPIKEPKRTPPIAVSGRVEISEIRIERVKASDASPNADLTFMQIALWVNVGHADGALVRLTKLNDVADDKGKTLSTRKRRSGMDFLNREVRASEFKTSRGRSGPVITMVLDAPTRSASQLQKLSGQFEILVSGQERVELKDLPSLVGKPLKNKLLNDIQIVPRIEKDDFGTNVTLAVTGKRSRLVDWTVVNNGESLRASAEFKEPLKNGLKVGRSFRERISKKSSLWIWVATAGKKHVVDFSFSDLKLP